MGKEHNKYKNSRGSALQRQELHPLLAAILKKDKITQTSPSQQNTSSWEMKCIQGNPFEKGVCKQPYHLLQMLCIHRSLCQRLQGTVKCAECNSDGHVLVLH